MTSIAKAEIPNEYPCADATSGPIILFDGVCNLCSSSVQFVIERDSKHQFRFASLQSSFADDLLGRFGPSDSRLSSIVLFLDGSVHVKSSAALRTARKLDGFWPLMSLFLIVPRPLRDAVYDWIGRHRYQWFGKREACWIPDAELSERFLDHDDDAKSGEMAPDSQQGVS